jgi:hypothetical protein
MNREPATTGSKQGKTFHRLTSWPKPNLPQAFSRQILPVNAGEGVILKAHRSTSQLALSCKTGWLIPQAHWFAG